MSNSVYENYLWKYVNNLNFDVRNVYYYIIIIIFTATFINTS